MNRLLLVLVSAICLTAIVGIAGATVLDFQSVGENGTVTEYTTGTTTEMYQSMNTSGANSYEYLSDTDAFGGSADCVRSNGHLTIIKNTAPYPMTYAAATMTGNGRCGIIMLYDSSGNEMSPGNLDSGFTVGSTRARYEMQIIGSRVDVYVDGVIATTNLSIPQNPSWVGIGVLDRMVGSEVVTVDDVIFGSTESKTVLGMPEPNAYYLKKDLTNPAATGFYNLAGTQISSTAMPGTFSRSALSGALANESIYLINQDTGTAYLTNYTGTATTGDIKWDIASFIAGTAPYGMYQTKLGTTLSTDIIPYIAGGATIAFDRDNYVVGDTATLTYTIETDYWIPGTYTYSIKIYDVYGNLVSSQAITTNTGSVTYVWQSDDTQGVYYGEIIGTPLAGGDNVLFNYDYTTLTATIKLFGYVNEDESTLPISGAMVNASQGSTWSNTTSNASGYYETDNLFLTGVLLGYNTSASGYQTYWNNFTAMKQPPQINVTLSKISHTLTDITLGGVARDTMYHNPVASARVDILNETDGQYWYATTNLAGFYNKTFVTEDNTYNIWGSKTGFLNSTIYTLTAVAS